MLKILTGNAQLDQNYEQALLYAQRWLAADPVDSDVKKALRQINAGLAN